MRYMYHDEKMLILNKLIVKIKGEDCGILKNYTIKRILSGTFVT